MRYLQIDDSCKDISDLLDSPQFLNFLEEFKVSYIERMKEVFSSLDMESYIVGVNDVVGDTLKYVRALTPENFKPFFTKMDLDMPLEKVWAKVIPAAIDHMTRSYLDSYSRLSVKQYLSFENLAQSASELGEIIYAARAIIIDALDFELDGDWHNEYFSVDLRPNVSVLEISAKDLNLPDEYAAVKEGRVVLDAFVKTGSDINFETPANKRVESWDQINKNPFDAEKFKPKEWSMLPLNIGGKNILACIHKSEGSIAMEAGILNLFPLQSIEELYNSKPEGIFFFGNPDAADEDFGFYQDEKNNLLVGVVPGRDLYKYFGYVKKPLLTMVNCLAIEKGEMPLHCGAMSYKVKFDGEEAIIAESLVVADDMASLKFVDDKILIKGTEVGAFSCTDGFEENVKQEIEAKAIGYNGNAGTNARRVFKVSEKDEVLAERSLDALLYMNNYSLQPKHLNGSSNGIQNIDFGQNPEFYFDNYFRHGWRVGAGSTQTPRGEKEYSFWANPFPMLRDEKGEILHSSYAEKFADIEEKLIEKSTKLVSADKLRVGVAFSQMMAGEFKENSQEKLLKMGYSLEEITTIDFERVGPAALAQDMVKMILEIAKSKRASDLHDEVEVCIAFVGDSRTGKSETLEAMSTILKNLK